MKLKTTLKTSPKSVLEPISTPLEAQASQGLKKLVPLEGLGQELGKDLGKVDINFPEFCLGVIGKNSSHNQPLEIIYQDKKNPDKFIKIVRSGKHFPEQSARDLLLCLLRLTLKKDGFSNRKVPVSANEILREMGKSVSGSALKVLRKDLTILNGTLIQMQNTFYDKNQQLVKENVSFSILSGFMLREFKNGSSNLRTKSSFKEDPNYFWGWIWWNETFFDLSLKNARNLIDVDYTQYRSINGDISKQLFLFLSKRSYNQTSLRLELEVLAFEKLGMNPGLAKTKIRQQLKKAFAELLASGFLKHLPKIVKDGQKKEYVQFWFTESFDSDFVDQGGELETSASLNKLSQELLMAQSKKETIAQKLIQLNFTEGQAGRFLRQYAVEKIELGIAYLEFLEQKSGAKIRRKDGLLADILLHPEKYDLLDFAKQQWNWQQTAKEREIEASQQKQAREKAELEEIIKAKQEAQMREKIQSWLANPQNQNQYHNLVLAIAQELEQARGKAVDFQNLLGFYHKHYQQYKSALEKLMPEKMQALEQMQTELEIKNQNIPPIGANGWFEACQELDRWKEAELAKIEQKFAKQEQEAKIKVVESQFAGIVERRLREVV